MICGDSEEVAGGPIVLLLLVTGIAAGASGVVGEDEVNVVSERGTGDAR